jgi:hypothetical protein
MSFYLPFTRAEQSTEMIVSPGAQFYAEGQVAVVAQGATSAGVLPSTGTGTDVFAGFVFAGTSAAPFNESYYNKVEQFVVPSTGIVTLSLAPLAGQLFAFDTTTGAPATGYTVTGQNVSGLVAGDTVNITYKYALTVIQARALYGDIQPGGYIGNYVGQIGVITRGTVWTTEYAANQNWSAALSGGTAAGALVMAANGQVTLGTPTPGTGPLAIPGYVIGVPGQDVPFLGITFSAA